MSILVYKMYAIWAVVFVSCIAFNVALMLLLPGWFKLVGIPVGGFVTHLVGRRFGVPIDETECGCVECTRSIAGDARLATTWFSSNHERALGRSLALLDTYYTRLARKSVALPPPPMDIPGIDLEHAQQIASAVPNPAYVVCNPDTTNANAISQSTLAPSRNGTETSADLLIDMIHDIAPVTLTSTQAAVVVAAYKDCERERDLRQMRCIGPFDETTAAAVISFLGLATLTETVNVARAVTAP